jgi:dolichol kinase
LACFVGGFLTALVYLNIFIWSGTLEMPYGIDLTKLLLVSAVGTAVESLPIKDWDNLTVTLAVALISQALLA